MGLLLLGRKVDGSLSTEEEIGLARSIGERIVEGRASAELGRRLIAIQRGRLAETQIVDRQMHRLLHDEVLPRLHAAILTSKEPAAARELSELHRVVSDALHSLHPALSGRAARDGLVSAVRNLVEDEMADSFESASVCVDTGANDAAARITELSREVAYGAVREAVRNAARHGRGPEPERALHLTVRVRADEELAITVADDGVGFPMESAEAASSGNGLALHATMMAMVGGSFQVASGPNGGARVVITVPIS